MVKKSSLKVGSHKLGSHEWGSQVVWIFFRFTFFQSSHISREPVNLGSRITHAPFFNRDVIFKLKKNFYKTQKWSLEKLN